MVRLIPILAIMGAVVAAVIFTAPPAGAQSTAPTFSTVAITSNPGMDETYATGDIITVAVTFSEAVTVSTGGGTPRITLDLATQPRYAGYTGAGSATGQIPFGYTVLVGDYDAVGVSVKGNSLAPDGGTIQATDDSANAALTHPNTTFASHKVDTEVILVSNLNQPESPSTVTISATHSYWLPVTARVDPGLGLSLPSIVLNVKTPSDTLDVKVRASVVDREYRDLTFSGTAATSGLQTFNLSTPA